MNLPNQIINLIYIKKLKMQPDMNNIIPKDRSERVSIYLILFNFIFLKDFK